MARNFALAVAMIAAIELTLRLAESALAGAGAENAADGGGVFAMPLIPLGITAALLGAVLAGAKLMALASSADDARRG